MSPQSPQIRRKNYAATGGLITPPTPGEGGRPSPVQKRPVSLMRSLDLMDNMEMATRGTASQKAMGSPQDLERRSAYDMNYEISV